MVKIEIVEDSMRGEPGPTLYWSGEPQEFLDIAVALHVLGTSDGVSLDVNELPCVQVQTGLSIVAHSRSNGRTLVKSGGDKVSIELDCELWRQIIHRMVSVSFALGFDYVEFEDLEMIGETNFIIDSSGLI